MHKSVLLQESVDALSIEPGEIILDGTLGAGGHTKEVLRRFGDKVRAIGIDLDGKSLERVKAELGIEAEQESFKNLDKVLEKLGIDSVDAILLDLGFSSEQLEDPERGLSFQTDGPLDMRLRHGGEVDGLTAADILNSWDESAIELILRGFGEERYSKRIARAIVERREKKPFATTFDLVEVVKSASPAAYRHGKIHPATRTFQALRIATNEELETLEVGLKKGFDALKSGGRLVVISFHSLEDRIVKNFFKQLASDELAKIITKKPVTASEEEINLNPRSRSAKLRVIEKI